MYYCMNRRLFLRGSLGVLALPALESATSWPVQLEACSVDSLLAQTPSAHNPPGQSSVPLPPSVANRRMAKPSSEDSSTSSRSATRKEFVTLMRISSLTPNLSSTIGPSAPRIFHGNQLTGYAPQIFPTSSTRRERSPSLPTISTPSTSKLAC